MASINYAAREISVKIVYYGPGLSGKTTNLQVIHRKVPKEYKSDMVSLATETDRTLFFDFLPLNLGQIRGFATKFQLYTVPGQVYYNATRKLVLRGVDGIVFVADSASDKVQENIESLQNLEENLREYGYELQRIPTIIQWNKRDLPNALPIPELEAQINRYRVHTIEASAFRAQGVFETLKLIGKVVIDELNKKYSRPGMRRPAAPAPRPQPGPAAPPQQPAPRPEPSGFQQSPFQQQQPPAQQQPQSYQQQDPFANPFGAPPPEQPPQSPPPPPQNQAGFGTIDLEPLSDTSKAPNFTPPPPPPANPGNGGKSDLDLEIERYQNEIQQGSTESFPAVNQNSPFQGGNYGQQQPPQQHAEPTFDVGSSAGQQNTQGNFYPQSPQQQSPYAPPQQDQGQAYPPQPRQPQGDYDSDNDQMFFTSVSSDKSRKPKKPVNPKNRQKRGFLGRLFNKGE
jgi:hypothetical protein